MDYNKKGSDSYQGRRDYDRHDSGSGRKHFTTRKPSQEGGAERVFTTDGGDQRSYAERQAERRPRTDRPYRSDRNYHSDRNFHTDRAYDSGRSYDSEERAPRAYGDRPAYSERRSQGRSYGDGERRSYDRGEGRSYGERKSYSEGRSYSDRPQRSGYGRPQGGPGKGKKGVKPAAKLGIEAMVSRKAADDRNNYSDNDNVATPIQEVVRLNKFIANSGVCSRREADTLIQSGVVTVNGEVVTELGSKVNVLVDEVRFNGERLKGEDKVYIVMNKPKGYVTTASDPHAEKTVMMLLRGCPKRVFPVGRLDKNTTGVLMFTNDGEMAERLTHPSYNKKKIYQVVLDHPLTEEDKEKVLAGIELTDGVVAADELEYIDARDHRQLGIEIHSGKNRIVRRIFESLGYEVKALDRVYFAGLTKKGLKKGDWRYLTEGEVNILKMGAYV